MLTSCQNYHDDYAYPGGRVAMSDGDGMAFNTQVLVVRCVWVYVAMSSHARHLLSPLPENSTPLVLIRCQNPPDVAPGSPSMS
jgi:hypothetical protein